MLIGDLEVRYLPPKPWTVPRLIIVVMHPDRHCEVCR